MIKLKTFVRFSLLTIILFISSILNSYAQNYWQQEVKYQINVRLDDTLHFLHGNETIIYKNNSPEALPIIWFHIWPNAYKSNRTPFAKQELQNGKTTFHFSNDSQRGYIDSLTFLVDRNPIQVIYNDEFPDVCKLILNTPLAPGKSIEITTPFRVKIPNSFSRFGHVANSYQITQWYPKPAVFDSKGWHPISYLDQGEFYSEFGTFDVNITLPKNYVVAATGNLLTESENIFLDSLSKVKIDSSKSKSKVNVISSKTFKTISYHQEQVHDFAWFADKTFIVKSSEQELPYSKRKVKTFAYFTPPNAKKWEKGTRYINEAIYNYSLWNGDYPYSVCTAVDGALSAGGGMEYPTITIIGPVSNANTLQTVIVHEVGHNWFYGILGSNEREFGWLDEGVNSFFEQRLIKQSRKQKLMIESNALNNFFKLKYFPQGYEEYLTYMFAASKHEDQPIQTHSENFTELNYGAIMYTKTALSLNYLQEYLGRPVFDSAMHIYFERWKFKHPYPEDFQAVMQEVSGKNLDWFFVSLFKYNDPIDFKIKGLKKQGKQLQVKLKNKSVFPAPVFISSLDRRDSVLETFKMEPYVGTAIFFFDKHNVKRIKVDPFYVIPEIKRSNNAMKVNGVFRKTEKINFQLLASLKNPDRSQLFYMPLLAYNHVDQLMPGLALYNHVFPFRKFEFDLAPFYSIKLNKLNGTGRLSYYTYPSFVKSLVYSIQFNSFSYNKSQSFAYDNLGNQYKIDIYQRFRKLAFNANFELKQSSERSLISQNITYRFVNNIFNEKISLSNLSNFEDVYSSNFHILNYLRIDRNIRVPKQLKANLEVSSSNNDTYEKISLSYEVKLKYLNSNKGVSFRFFAGVSLGNPGRFGQEGLFSMSGDIDYLFDQSFVNRTQIQQQQFFNGDGGFKSQLYLPNVNQLFAFNVKAPLKIPFPVGVFADISYQPDVSLNKNFQVTYDLGLYLPIYTDVIEVYFPVFISTYDRLFPEITNTKPKFAERIRVMVNLNSLQPLYLLRRIGI